MALDIDIDQLADQLAQLHIQCTPAQFFATNLNSEGVSNSPGGAAKNSVGLKESVNTHC